MRKFVFVGAMLFFCVSMMAQTGLTGIWYSTWYVKYGEYIWQTGHGANSNKQFLADVNGDGKDDAVVFFGSSGKWYVALSNGDGFNNYSLWADGHGASSANQFLGDINGDKKADAIVYFSNGTWYVAYSNGTTQFGSASVWKNGHGSGSKTQFVADVNGDKKVDAIVFFDVASDPSFQGKWYVALTGGGTGCWHTGHGSGSQKQFVADVNGDGKADAIVFFDVSDLKGNWYVALSSGSGFGGYSQWIAGHGAGSHKQIMGDVNMDGKADAVIYLNQGDWYVATSSGTKFNNYSSWQLGTSANASAIWVGNPKGGDKSASVAFYSSGQWCALPNGYNRPVEYNLWQAWDIKILPYSQGKYQQYDCGNPEVLREHLKEISEAKIDYLLMDETNNIYVDKGAYYNRAIAMAREMKKWNENPANRPMRYAFAVGGIQFNGNAQQIENEAKIVWNDVINKEGTGGLDTYLIQDGKPLLVCYYGQESYRTAWRNLPSHEWSDKFTIRWCNGDGAKDYYGWGLQNGSIYSTFLMEVMPGWNNKKGRFVSRSGGTFYSTYCWDRVLSQKPDQVIINSYNEFAEETAVAKANTQYVTGNSEKWGSPDMYWNATVNYVNQYKNAKNCVTPTANFTVDKTHSDTPADFKFTHQTSNAINFQWDFGDGNYSIEPNPTHRYERNGVYTVKLKVTGTKNSATATKTDYITIGTTVDTKNAQAAAQTTLYPNPTMGKIAIDSSEKVEKMAVYDLQGRLLGNFAPTDNTLDLTHLNAGTYLVEIQNAKGKIVRKVVKK